jgi:hypothetical protein
MEPTIRQRLDDLRAALEGVMASPDASAEYLSAMGHVDGAVRDLDSMDRRLAAEAGRDALEAGARASGAYGDPGGESGVDGG